MNESIKVANRMFFMCIVLEVIGAMTTIIWGGLGAQMTAYAMTAAYAIKVNRKHTDIKIPIQKPKIKDVSHVLAITACGMPVAMLLNVIAGFFIKRADGGEVLTVYPFWLSLLCFAVVPAVVEEYIFRGIILSAYEKTDIRMAILFSSLYFSILHFDVGGMLCGFFFGLTFAVIRIYGGNLMLTILMHVFFNGINVIFSYAEALNIPNIVFLALLFAGATGYGVLLVSFVKNHIPVKKAEQQSKKYEIRECVTKEGAAGIIICMVIMLVL